jgi:Fe-S-cluster containining protein
VPLPPQDRQLLQIVDAAFADSARRSGPHLVCRPGCTQCCHGAFAINALDAQRLGEGMAQLTITAPEKAAEIRNRADKYWKEFAPDFPGDPITGILGESEAEQEAFEDFANEAACPALNPENGLCELYEFRPMTCRIFGPPVRSQAEPHTEDDPKGDFSKDAEPEEGLAICELCFTTATPEEIQAAEMQVPHKEEEALLNQLTQSGNTIIAHCLITNH